MRQLANEKKIQNLLIQYGSHSLAWSCLQPGLDYFISEHGFLAYRKRLGINLVLGDPVCAENYKRELLSEFIKAKPRCAFIQISQHTKQILQSMGFRITPFGVESELQINDFNLHGKTKRDLRHYRNKGNQFGIEVREIENAHDWHSDFQSISKQWIRTKRVRRREMKFLVRPLSEKHQPGVRVFAGFIEETLVGFVLFDPMHHDSQCTGYTASILRCLPDAPEGTRDCIILKAMEEFHDEGINRLNFGISPFYKMSELVEAHGAGSPLLYWVCRRLYDRSRIYNFKGLSFHKSRYRPNEIPSFVASRSRLGWEFASVWRACEVF